MTPSTAARVALLALLTLRASFSTAAASVATTPAPASMPVTSLPVGSDQTDQGASEMGLQSEGEDFLFNTYCIVCPNLVCIQNVRQCLCVNHRPVCN